MISHGRSTDVVGTKFGAKAALMLCRSHCALFYLKHRCVAMQGVCAQVTGVHRCTTESEGYYRTTVPASLPRSLSSQEGDSLPDPPAGAVVKGLTLNKRHFG